MTYVITGEGLTIEDVVKVARHNEKVELHPDAIKKMQACRDMLEEKIKAREVMYGITTGIGEFSETFFNEEETLLFQKYLIYNHAAGIGDAAPIEHVRAAMLAP